MILVLLMKIVILTQQYVVLETALNIAAERDRVFIAILVPILPNALTITSQVALLIMCA
jgi:hypothetical protein